jgi:hypothetical protein
MKPQLNAESGLNAPQAQSILYLHPSLLICVHLRSTSLRLCVSAVHLAIHV